MAKKKWPPVKYDREKIAKDLLEYTRKTDIPIVAEFCYEQGLRRDYLYQMSWETPVLANSIKLCILKKEFMLEKLALQNKVNTTMAIFSLKQIGWRDKWEIGLDARIDADHKVNASVKLEELTDDELEALIRIAERASGSEGAEEGASQ